MTSVYSPLQHFREDVSLSEKLEGLISHATHWHMMNPSERNAAMEVDSMYKMQKEAMDEISPVMELKLCKDVHLVSIRMHVYMHVHVDVHAYLQAMEIYSQHVMLLPPLPLSPHAHSLRSHLSVCCYGTHGKQPNSSV